MKWQQYKLGDVCDFQGGSQPPKSKFISEPKEGYVRLLQIRDFKSDDKAVYIPDVKKNRVCSDDDVMIGRYGASVGQIHRGKSGAYNVALIKTIPNESFICKDFLYLYLQSASFQKALISVAKRSAQAGFSKADISPFNIVLPSIPEQKRIVSILDQAFADLEQVQAKTEQNLKNARELFDSYLQQVFSQRGEGWVEKEIGDVADLSRGQNPPKSEFISEPREGYVRFYQIRDGKSDKFAVYVPENSKLHYVNETDILMVAYRHVGNAFRGVKGAFNVALCKIVNKDKEALHDDFLYHLIPSSFIKGELLKVSERSLIPSMSVKHLAQLKIPIPPPHEQDEIVRKINMMEKECNRLEFIYKQKVEAVDELKKSILQKAFSGELTTTAK